MISGPKAVNCWVSLKPALEALCLCASSMSVASELLLVTDAFRTFTKPTVFRHFKANSRLKLLVTIRFTFTGATYIIYLKYMDVSGCIVTYNFLKCYSAVLTAMEDESQRLSTIKLHHSQVVLLNI